MNRGKKVQTERTEGPKSERLKSEHKLVRFVKPNVQITALYCTYIEMNRVRTYSFELSYLRVQASIFI